jgi:zinc transport system permease protein
MADLSALYDLLRLVPLEPLQHRFAQRALVALVLLAPMCASMGVHVINYRMAFFSDAISHSAFAGVAIALLIGGNEYGTMTAFALLVGLGIVAAARRSRLSSDAIIGVFFSAAVAFGLAVVSHYRHLARSMQMFLYGDILTIGEGEVLWMAALLGAVVLFQALSFNRLLYVGLSSSLAAAHGLSVRLYQYLLAALLSLVAIFSVWAVGVLLVTAMLIVPAAAARNLARSAGGMFWWAMLVSLSSAVAGLFISFWTDTATGATIILVASGWFAVSAVVRLGKR